MFVHSPYIFETLEQRTANNGFRVYQTPDGSVYPSVTTILKPLNQRGIMEWRAKVGNEEANRIVAKASSRGKRTEKVIESYIKNEEVHPDPFSLFYSMKPVLDEHLTLVNNLQAPLYSHRLKVAGTADIIGEWDGIPSLIDLKTSLKPKKEQWILSYFYQVTIYAMCMYELTGIKLNQTVIFIGVDNEPPQTFVNPTGRYLDEVYEFVMSNK